jgi:hypothetical protein
MQHHFCQLAAQYMRLAKHLETVKGPLPNFLVFFPIFSKPLWLKLPFFCLLRVVDTLAPTTLFRAFNLGPRRRTRHSRFRTPPVASVSAPLVRTSRCRRALRTCGLSSTHKSDLVAPPVFQLRSNIATICRKTAAQPAWLNQIR